MSDFGALVKECLRNMKLNRLEAPDGTKDYYSFIGCISRYKHHSFKEENEVRIFCAPIIKNEKNLKLAKRKFRTKGGKLIPYIELFNSTDIILPIERIIVGPHRDKESRASALRVKLRNTNIEVTTSDIPYVD